MPSDVVWTVLETSPAGATLAGVYSTLEKARSVVALLAGGRLEDYRIEGHVLDSTADDRPWQVTLGRGGEHLDTAPYIGCACADDEVEFYKRSYIAAGGEYMSVIVFAPTPGPAITTAVRYREWLKDEGLWSEDGRPLEPLQVRTSITVEG